MDPADYFEELLRTTRYVLFLALYYFLFVTLVIGCSQAPAVKITAEPDTIAPGNTSTLTWNSEHAVSCTIEPDIGVVAVSGAVDVVPVETTTYTITAVDPGGGTSRAQVLVQLYPIKIQRIDKSQAHYTTPENTMAASTSALLQHDLEWFHETFTEEAVAFEKQLYADAGIDPASSFDLIDENDEEYILDKKPYKDGLLIITENRYNDIDGTILTGAPGQPKLTA